MKVDFDSFIDELIKNNYSLDDLDLIKRAFVFASEVHKGVFRKSGDPYIIHPLEVAKILVKMNLDAETIAAGLLHDCEEDGINVTFEIIAKKFGITVAKLVDSVSKIPKSKFESNSCKRDDANLRKFMCYSYFDLRAYFIKIADRLHNMRTLEYHTIEKQRENALETMEIFVPLSNMLGMYTIKCELEDLSFKYLEKEKYDETVRIKNEYIELVEPKVEEILSKINKILENLNVKYDVIVKYKSLYSLYKKLGNYEDIRDIHDFAAIKIILPNEFDCYCINEILKPYFDTVYDKCKDYIRLPKSNLYRGLHTTILEDGSLFQLQFKTHDMYMVNAYGLPAYAFLYKSRSQAINSMMSDAAEMPFYNILKKIMKYAPNESEFASFVKELILKERVYVFTESGTYALPQGSLLVDYVFLNGLDKYNIESVYVNGKTVNLSTVLKNKDRILIKYRK